MNLNSVGHFKAGHFREERFLRQQIKSNYFTPPSILDSGVKMLARRAYFLNVWIYSVSN